MQGVPGLSRKVDRWRTESPLGGARHARKSPLRFSRVDGHSNSLPWPHHRPHHHTHAVARRLCHASPCSSSTRRHFGMETTQYLRFQRTCARLSESATHSSSAQQGHLGAGAHASFPGMPERLSHRVARPNTVGPCVLVLLDTLSRRVILAVCSRAARNPQHRKRLGGSCAITGGTRCKPPSYPRIGRASRSVTAPTAGTRPFVADKTRHFRPPSRETAPSTCPT